MARRYPYNANNGQRGSHTSSHRTTNRTRPRTAKQSNWLDRAQAKAGPWRERFRGIRTKLDEGAILRKRIVVITLLSLMVISLAAGKLLSPPSQVIETSPNVQKEFVSGNTIELQSTAYDPSSHTARMDLQTTSPTGVVAPQDLSVNFLSLKRPDPKLPAPQLYMVPTVNNHYIVIVRDLYSGFDALELLFHDRGDYPLAQYQNALENGSNGASPADLSNSSDLSSNTHVGALNLSDDDKSSLLSSSSNPNVQDKQRSIIQGLQKSDKQLIVQRENSVFKKKASIPTTLNPKDISIDDINKKVTSLQSKIDNDNNRIHQNEALLNKMKKQSSTLSKDATVDKHYQSEIDDLNGNINDTQQDDQNLRSDITKSQRQVNSYNDEINQLKNDRISFSAPVQQSSSSFSSK